MANDFDLSGKELKARFAQLARAKVPFNPVDVIDITGANVERLQKSMKSFGWSDARFVTEAQVVANGWSINPMAESVEVVLRNDQKGLTENVALFNAGNVLGMPSLGAMLAMSDVEIATMRGRGPVEPEVEDELSIGPARSVAREVGETERGVLEDTRLYAIEDNYRGLAPVPTNALSAAEVKDIVAEDVAALRGISNKDDRFSAAVLMGANAHDQESYLSELVRQAPDIAVEAVESLERENAHAHAFLEEQATARSPDLLDSVSAEPSVDSTTQKVEGEGVSDGIEDAVGLDRFAAMAPYWLDGLHNAEGVALAKKINLDVKARGLAEDRDAIAQLMAIHSKARALGLGVVPEMQYLNDPELKQNRGEPGSLLDGAFVRDKEGAYRPKAGGVPVLQDKGSSLVLKSKGADAYRGVMELAKAKGWTAIELKGPKAMLANAWMEAQLMRPPLDVVNYKPTSKETEKLAEKLAARVVEESKLRESIHVRPMVQASERVEVRPFVDANGQEKMATMTYTVSYKGGELAEFGNAKDAAAAFAGVSPADSPVVVRSVIRADGVVTEGVVAGVAPGVGKGGLAQVSENMLDHEFDDAMGEVVAKERAEASLKPGRVEAGADGNHYGPIVAIDGNRIAQKIGREAVVWHDVSKLHGVVPKIGEHAEIGYAKGLGIIKKKVLEAELDGGGRGLER